MNRIWRLIETVIGAISILALAALILLPSLQVVLRGAFDAPLIGLEEATRWGLIILVFMCIDGKRGPNKYGPDPKGGVDPSVFA